MNSIHNYDNIKHKVLTVASDIHFHMSRIERRSYSNKHVPVSWQYNHCKLSFPCLHTYATDQTLSLPKNSITFLRHIQEGIRYKTQQSLKAWERRSRTEEEQITASEPPTAFRLSTKPTRTMCLCWRQQISLSDTVPQNNSWSKPSCQRLVTHNTPFDFLALCQTTLSGLLHGSFCITDKDRT